MQDELTLLARVKELDPQALAEVHDNYYSGIFRFISFRVGDQDTAEDLTSEVFTRFLSAVRDRSAPQNTIRGWLYGVASRVVADHYRKKYRMEEVELMEMVESDIVDPGLAVSRRLTLAELHQALRELTEDQQNVIALRFGYEMRIREVAETMGKSEGAIKQLQARAVATLSQKLSAWSLK